MIAVAAAVVVVIVAAVVEFAAAAIVVCASTPVRVVVPAGAEQVVAVGAAEAELAEFEPGDEAPVAVVEEMPA